CLTRAERSHTAATITDTTKVITGIVSCRLFHHTTDYPLISLTTSSLGSVPLPLAARSAIAIRILLEALACSSSVRRWRLVTQCFTSSSSDEEKANFS